MKSGDGKPTCATCPFWAIAYKGDWEQVSLGCAARGECRRVSEVFPERWSDCWCGCHPEFAIGAIVREIAIAPVASSDSSVEFICEGFRL